MKKLFIALCTFVCNLGALTVPGAASPTREVASLQSASIAPEKERSIKGWEIVQDNPHTGEWHVFLCNLGMAATNKKLGCTLVTRGPEWNVFMYNDKTKVCFSSTLAKWKGLPGAMTKTGQTYGPASFSDKPPQKIKDMVFLDHKAVLYRTDSFVTSGLKKVEFAVTPDVKVPIELRQVFGKLYGVRTSRIGGLPLKVAYIDENGKASSVFETRKIDWLDIPLKTFSAPADYKKVDTEIAVLIDKKGGDEMERILKDLGTEDEGKDLEKLLDEKPQTIARKDSDESKKDNRDESAAVSPTKTVTEETGGGDIILGLIIPLAGVLIGCGALGGAAYLYLKRKS